MPKTIESAHSSRGSKALDQDISNAAVKGKAQYRRIEGILDHLQGGGLARAGKGVDEEVGLRPADEGENVLLLWGGWRGEGERRLDLEGSHWTVPGPTALPSLWVATIPSWKSRAISVKEQTLVFALVFENIER